MKRFMERPAWLERMLDWIYPKKAVCMGCNSAVGFGQPWLCDGCRRALARRWIGAYSVPGLDGMAVAYYYQGPAGSVVRNMKFRGVTDLTALMVQDMLRACRQIQPLGADLVVPVPMHPRRLRRRGFNHAELLAQGVAAGLALPFENVLIRTRNTPQQSQLEDEARRKNLEGAFCADESVRGKRVLLVDDVYTTGETARQCAAALRSAGAASVSLLVYTMGRQ